MPRKRTLGQRSTHSEPPDWQPLIDVLLSGWMWMYWVELNDGRRLDVYKHYYTRCNLHLTSDGRAFVYMPNGRYREANTAWMVDECLKDAPDVRGSDHSGPWLD